jgi:hypothetical protein
MKLDELKHELSKYPEADVRFILPNGESIPPHAHVTEVGRIDKRFIDCGGTLRTDSLCRLQTWFADDAEHRLTAGKLAKILTKAVPVLMSDDLEVDVEHEVGFISQFPVESVAATPDAVTFHLTVRHTDCLAKEQCKPVPSSAFDPLTVDFRKPQAASNCCGGKTVCK